MKDAGGYIVAIDGPGGVGKSTVSRRVAARIGAAHLDTGAFYRAATLAVLDDGADPRNTAEVMRAWRGRTVEQDSGGRTYLDGRDVSGPIRGERVTAAVSAVSAHPALRAEMVAAQQAWVAEREGPAVVEGRDIGTVVFPDARVKVFLDADPVVRAARRAREIGGEESGIARELERRDRLDSHRAASPLAAADDAVVVDTTDLGIDEVVEVVVALIEERSAN